jgi:hypothetical protein
MTTPEQLAEQIAAGRRGELADFDLVAMIRQYTAEIEAVERERCVGAENTEALRNIQDHYDGAYVRLWERGFEAKEEAIRALGRAALKLTGERE